MLILIFIIYITISIGVVIGLKISTMMYRISSKEDIEKEPILWFTRNHGLWLMLWIPFILYIKYRYDKFKSRKSSLYDFS